MKVTTLKTMFAALASLFIIGLAFAQPAPITAPDLPPGWRWDLEPVAPTSGWIERGWTRFVPSGILTLVGGVDGAVHVEHIRSARARQTGAKAIEYAVHLLDAEGRRLRLGWAMSASDRFIVYRYSAPAGTAASVSRIGLAVLDEDGRRARAAVAAKAATEVGAAALPFPDVGRPFTFDLPTLDGGRVRSEDLRGKVVLIDCWATWCTPCMEKMPALKALAKKYRERGLVVIGVTFDDDENPARRVIRERELDWPHVHAAATAAKYDGDLWQDLTTITTIPRLFLIDRAGVLRADFHPDDLEAQVAPYLEDDTTSSGDR